MADGEQPAATPPAQPPATSDPATPPAEATPAPKVEDGATTPEKTVTLKESDYKKLVSSRDKANNENSATGDFVLQLAKEREIGTFLEANKAKYSYVKQEDLMHLDDPEQLADEAARIQRRMEDTVQEALLNVQEAKPPILSPEDKAKELKRLKTEKPRGGFQKMLELQQQPNN